jgi:hypothetical protein
MKSLLFTEVVLASTYAGIQDHHPHEKVLIHVGADRPRPTPAHGGHTRHMPSWSHHSLQFAYSPSLSLHVRS